MALDLLETMTQILEVIGLEPDDLPYRSTFNKWLDRIGMAVWRVLLRHSAQLHDPSPRVAIDAAYYERSPASKHYCDRTNYRAQTIEARKLVNTETQAILNVHCATTREGSDADVCAQLARVAPGELQSLVANKGYDSQPLRDTVRDLGIRPLIKHRIFAPHSHAYDARIDNELSGQVLVRLGRPSANLVP